MNYSQSCKRSIIEVTQIKTSLKDATNTLHFSRHELCNQTNAFAYSLSLHTQKTLNKTKQNQEPEWLVKKLPSVVRRLGTPGGAGRLTAAGQALAGKG